MVLPLNCESLIKALVLFRIFHSYERVDEIIWVKTNQLQRIIRTGRTGHWLNHGKEHCLVSDKGAQVQEVEQKGELVGLLTEEKFKCCGIIR